MNIITTSLLTLACISSTSMSATLFTDDFSSDSSANYTGSGFSVSGGQLDVNISTTLTNVTHTSAFEFGVGSWVSVEVLDTRAQFELESLVLSTDLAVTDRITVGRGTFNGGVSNGWHFFADGGQLAPRVSGNASPAVFKITRSASDTFELEVSQSGSEVASYTHVDASWATVNEFYVGTRQSRDTGTATVSYDNLSVSSVAVPEPSSSLLLCSSLLGGLLIRRRN